MSNAVRALIGLLPDSHSETEQRFTPMMSASCACVFESRRRIAANVPPLISVVTAADVASRNSGKST
jgi:hypothetical protein